MVQVEIFVHSNSGEIQRSANNWLANHPEYKIINISLSEDDSNFKILVAYEKSIQKLEIDALDIERLKSALYSDLFKNMFSKADYQNE
jgi:hypothetical protein